MSSTSERPTSEQTRTYNRASSVVFLKTDEPFGGLSNMAGGYPLQVQGTHIYTSEALYQASRFPHLPEVQRLIIAQASPMTAKMKSKPNRKNSRPDWDRVRVKVMRWCLRVKLAQNWTKFSELLLNTGDRPIVEESRRDDFWGAKPVDGQTLIGMNVLGRLLMELRETVKSQDRDALRTVEPPDIPGFLLFGRPIEMVSDRDLAKRGAVSTPAASAPERPVIQELTEQASLFDVPSAREAPAPLYMPNAPQRAALAGLKPYPTIKDSGVSWLGDVPEHWQVLPNRAVFTEVRERDHPDAEMLSVTITKGVIRQQVLLEDSSKKDSSNQDRAAYKLVRPGDIAYNKMRAWQGAVGVSEYEGIVSPAYVVQRPHEGAAPRYLHYLLRTPAFAKEAERWSYGITSDMWSLRPEHFKMIYSCLPPLSEQTAIVRFLDHADRRVRRHIGAKQKLIKLLEEQKQAIIHRAVTRGLDPNVRLKPSGVEWLGEVPEHWEVSRLGRLMELVTGFPFKSEGFTQNEVDIRLLRGVNISPGRIRWNEVVRWPFGEFHAYKTFELRAGDIVLGMDRPIIQSGVRVAVVDECDLPALLLQRVARLRPNGELVADFLMLLLAGKGFANSLTPIFTGISVPHLSPEQIKSFRFALPSVAEQQEIVEWTRLKSKSLDTAIERASDEIALLREYRTCLIADVVTGKLDVREAAARLPEETEELEPLDEAAAVGDLGENAVEDLDAAPEEADA